MPTAVQSARVQCFLTVTGLFGPEARSARYGGVPLNPNWPGSAVRQLSAGRSRRSPSRPASGTPVRDVDHHSVGCRPVSYTHLRAHETPEHLVCRLLLEKKKNDTKETP